MCENGRNRLGLNVNGLRGQTEGREAAEVGGSTTFYT